MTHCARLSILRSGESLRPAEPAPPVHGTGLGWSLARPGWAASVAGLVLVITVGIGWHFYGPDTATSELASAIRAVDRTQQNYVRAIAELEKAASVVLARAEDPDLDSLSAAILPLRISITPAMCCVMRSRPWASQ